MILKVLLLKVDKLKCYIIKKGGQNHETLLQIRKFYENIKDILNTDGQSIFMTS